MSPRCSDPGDHHAGHLLPMEITSIAGVFFTKTDWPPPSLGEFLVDWCGEFKLLDGSVATCCNLAQL